jgi:hypothetical protein
MERLSDIQPPVRGVPTALVQTSCHALPPEAEEEIAGSSTSRTLAALLERLVPGAGAADVPAFVEREAAGHAELFDRGLAELDAVGFTSLTPDEQDELLRRMEGGAFFETVRTLAVQGMFSRRAGYELLGYPGPKAAWSAEEQRLG